MNKNDLRVIQDQIGYNFNNEDLLQQAFTRRSYSAENGGVDNEVLEFIGDKVLDFAVVRLLISKHSNATAVFEKFDPKLKNTLTYVSKEKTFPKENTFISDCNEAELTELKKFLVQKKTLAKRIDDLGLADFLIMGNSDIQNNANEEYSVREDLFEAILGAIAIDSNWNLDKLQSSVEIMLEPDSFLMESNEDNYVKHIQEWSLQRTNSIPLFHFEESSYQSTWYFPFDGISQQPRSLGDQEIHRTKFHCLLKISDELPIFRGFGQSKPEARKNVCKVAYDYLEKKDLLLSIRDEIENPNKNDAINQLEILARRGYFSIPVYTFDEQHDTDGNPIWSCKCKIAEETTTFSAKSSSKKDSKKTAAFEMLKYVLK